MSEKKRFVILIILLIISIGLVIYLNTSLGENFVRQLD